MDRIRALFQSKKDEAEYEPLTEDGSFLEDIARNDNDNGSPFSWMEYGIFALLGVAMLWAW